MPSILKKIATGHQRRRAAFVRLLDALAASRQRQPASDPWLRATAQPRRSRSIWFGPQRSQLGDGWL